MMNKRPYLNDAVTLLSELIATPSISREETNAADVMVRYMTAWGLNPKRDGNNVWAIAPHFDDRKPTILLNAHIDTVKPVASWTRDPFKPQIENGNLYGLGSNDCGGGLVSLLQAFRMLSAQKAEEPQGAQQLDLFSQMPVATKSEQMAFNLIYLASAEEEVSGKEGIARVLPKLPKIDVAIVGEPTGMLPAIAERGLMVIDGYAYGKSGHAARNEGINAIYEALDDLVWLRDHHFKKESPLLGPTKMSVTVVESGTQHNVVPDKLHFVVDVRTNEYYQNEYVFEYLKRHMKKCELKARSFRLHSSHIDPEHPLVRRCKEMGLKPFGSPTLSDQALMSFPSFKMGPGESSRSHSADEFIGLAEIDNAIETYMELLSDLTL